MALNLVARWLKRSFRLYVEDAGIEEKDAEWFGEKTWMKMRTVNSTMNVVEWDLDILKELTTDVQVRGSTLSTALSRAFVVAVHGPGRQTLHSVSGIYSVFVLP